MGTARWGQAPAATVTVHAHSEQWGLRPSRDALGTGPGCDALPPGPLAHVRMWRSENMSTKGGRKMLPRLLQGAAACMLAISLAACSAATGTDAQQTQQVQFSGDGSSEPVSATFTLEAGDTLEEEYNIFAGAIDLQVEQVGGGILYSEEYSSGKSSSSTPVTVSGEYTASITPHNASGDASITVSHDSENSQDTGNASDENVSSE